MKILAFIFFDQNHSPIIPAVVLLIVKFAFYIFWCWYGLNEKRQSPSFLTALGFATLRLGMGLTIGDILSLLGIVFFGLLGLPIFVIINFIEWTVISLLIRRETDILLSILSPTELFREDFLWRFGGMGAISSRNLSASVSLIPSDVRAGAGMSCRPEAGFIGGDGFRCFAIAE